MKIVYNRLLPFKGFSAINLFGVLFVRKGVYLSESTIRHEKIHTAQMKELGYVCFYIIYMLEWLVRLTLPGNAYRNISFEKEAYKFMHSPYYFHERRHFAQWL